MLEVFWYTMSNSKKSKKKEEDAEDVYVVEAVINKRKTKDGKNEFLLKWQGFPLEESTWEPEENVSCPELITEFERKQIKKEKRESQTSSSRNQKEVASIIGVTDVPGELHFLIKWRDDSADLIPAKEANVKLSHNNLMLIVAQNDVIMQYIFCNL
uniref:Chromo domain-containing protein n=1 Tax=Heterorhabditis bacteriophora TaxID=37862 RepID=A0A1I7WQZ8_HETBA